MATVDGTKFRQDMPPEGGYAKIYTQRTFPRISTKTGKRIALGVVVVWLAGYYKFRAQKRAIMRGMVEQNDVRLVMSAFLAAERDRLWLNHLRKLRDDERELMKNVPGWRVGTFYGEPIFFTLPPDHWWDPQGRELMVNHSYFNQRFMANWRLDADMRGGPRWYDKYLPHWLANY